MSEVCLGRQGKVRPDKVGSLEERFGRLGSFSHREARCRSARLGRHGSVSKG